MKARIVGYWICTVLIALASSGTTTVSGEPSGVIVAGHLLRTLLP